MYKLLTRFIAMTAFIVLNIPIEAKCQTREPLVLDQLLADTLAQLPAKEASMDLISSKWLSSSPSISVAYLSGSDSLTADETEVSVNLSINSISQQGINHQLKIVNQKILDNQFAQQKLYWSGIIRETLWELRLSEIKQNFLKLKQTSLEKLLQNSQSLFEAGESSELNLLRIRKELNATQIEQLEGQLQTNIWYQRYQNITGRSELPKDIQEPEVNPDQSLLSNHPEIVASTLSQKQLNLRTKMENGNSTPWQLSLTAKDTKLLGETDRQVGVSFELPLNFIEINRQSVVNQWEQQNKAIETSQVAMLFNIEAKQTKLLEQRRISNEKKQLLEKAVELGDSIMMQLDQLKMYNEIGQELILRQVLDVLETKYQLELTRTHIQQNNSMLRQTAGLSL